MSLKLLQLEERIRALELLADEVGQLSKKQSKQPLSGQPELNIKGQRWYRGARELMVQQQFSGLAEFEQYYVQILKDIIGGHPQVTGSPEMYEEFMVTFNAARALLFAVVDEIESRELPLKTQLSFAVSADEFDRASELVSAAACDGAILRAGGVVGRVALERHLWTVVDARGITVLKNPPHKKRAEVSDVLVTLVKAGVVTSVQKSELDSLFAVANNCAHPKEAVNQSDVERLIKRGRELASIIL
jgi:hypothetical protein